MCVFLRENSIEKQDELKLFYFHLSKNEVKPIDWTEKAAFFTLPLTFHSFPLK